MGCCQSRNSEYEIIRKFPGLSDSSSNWSSASPPRSRLTTDSPIQEPENDQFSEATQSQLIASSESDRLD